MVRCWHFSDLADLTNEVRSWGDIVAKVENGTTPKISRKQISRQLYRCNALHRRCEGPWSFSWETMRTLISPYTKRISGPRKFHSSPQKDFCNNIGGEADVPLAQPEL